MNRKQHTPGTWSVKKASPQAGIIIAPNRSLGIAEVFGGGETDIANARLISTAPDLLQVVEDYVLLCDLHDYVGAVPDAARAALRKAKGEA